MSLSPGVAAFKLSFQVSPIILSGGLAQYIPGGLLPIISLTEALNFTLGLLGGGEDVSLDNFFATFQVLPGGALIQQAVATYPFANQSVAANAVIAEPLHLSVLMYCPVREAGGYAAKLATMTALQAALAQHNNLGGTYTIATPSFFYTNCLLTGLVDVSGGESKQVQTRYRWDFLQPLLTLSQAQAAQNAMMSRITDQVPSTGALSGPFNTVNFPPSIASPSVVPAGSGVAGSGVAGSAGSFQ